MLLRCEQYLLLSLESDWLRCVKEKSTLVLTSEPTGLTGRTAKSSEYRSSSWSLRPFVAIFWAKWSKSLYCCNLLTQALMTYISLMVLCSTIKPSSLMSHVSAAPSAIDAFGFDADFLSIFWNFECIERGKSLIRFKSCNLLDITYV